MDNSDNSQYRSRKLSATELLTIVNALLACNYMQKRDRRDTVLYLLSAEVQGITDGISRRDDNKADVLEIVMTCSKHVGGLEKLAEIVIELEGHTATPAHELHALMHKIFISPVIAELSNIKGLETVIHEGPSAFDLNSVTLPHDEHTRKHFLRGIGFTETQIEYLPSLLTPRPIEYSSLFISYAHQDETVAKRLHTDLRNNDVPCWFAPHDLRPGTPILRGIEEAIYTQDKFLLILSKDAVSSAWIEREVDTALHQEIERGIDVLFPIRLDNAVLESNAGWATRLQHRHIGDFTSWQDDAAYQEAFTRLLQHLKVTQPPTNRSASS